jgi:NAD(P)H-quinone oxidoreductase subunit 6
MDQLLSLQGWMNTNADSYETIIFFVLAALAIPLAYGVIFDKVIIRSGFLLIGVFGAIAGLFMLLQAQFLAMAQLMIYAVGITLTVVIALMLTNPRMEQEKSIAVPANQFIGFLTAFVMFMTVYLALLSESFPITGEKVAPQAVLTNIGIALTTNYSLPFEFASVLLLAALVGAIVLAKNDAGREDELEYSVEEDAAEPKVPESATASR